MGSYSVTFILLLIGVATVTAYKPYQDKIPHGHDVLNPCDKTPWVGVGHRNPGGGGERNPFGLDFAAANHTWTQDLCGKDSDGDGMTNGVELGDPGCTWSTQNHGQLQPVKGHPGICEPVADAKCAGSWFKC